MPVPTAPEDLILSTVAFERPTQDITWVDESADEDGFRIEWSTDIGFSSLAGSDTVGAGVEAYTITGLGFNTTYYVRVFAYNEAGDSVEDTTSFVSGPIPLPGNPGDTDLVEWWLGNRTDPHVGLHAGVDLDVTGSPTPGSTTGKFSASVYSWGGSGQQWAFSTSTAFDITGTITMGAWIKRDVIGASIEGIMGNTHAFGSPGYSMTADTDGKVSLRQSTSSPSSELGDNVATGSTVLTPGEYYFVVGVLVPDGSMKVYVNGVLDGSNLSPTGATYNGSGTFYLANFWYRREFDGTIENAFVYTKELSPDNITWLYNSGQGRNYADLTA